MKYIWTEDTGAGLHFWELVNEYLFHCEFIVESKGSNQGLLEAARELVPSDGDKYFLAFDIVYDNMDVMNKYLELRELAAVYHEQVVILDMICFEYIILSFSKLVEWTGTGKKDKIAMGERILCAIADHRIDIGRIEDRKTKEYLMGFKRYSTERVIKAITYELTENDEWSVKGRQMGDCWHKDCCVKQNNEKNSCGIHKGMTGINKLAELFAGWEVSKIIK
jgi:hypothetical protein